jgi:hypothetical protein
MRVSSICRRCHRIRRVNATRTCATCEQDLRAEERRSTATPPEEALPIPALGAFVDESAMDQAAGDDSGPPEGSREPPPVEANSDGGETVGPPPSAEDVNDDGNKLLGLTRATLRP